MKLLEKDPAAQPENATVVRQRLEESRGAATSASAAAPTADANPLDRLASGVFVGREQEVARGRALFDDSFAGQPTAKTSDSAPEPSLLLLEFPARELGPARLFVIATYRDVELRRDGCIPKTAGRRTEYFVVARGGGVAQRW